MLDGFKKFIMRGNVVDLAVGVVIGAVFGAVVKAFTDGVLMQFIAALFKVPDFSKKAFLLNDTPIYWGAFVSSLITFLLTAAAVYFFIVMPLNKMAERRKAAQGEPDELSNEERMIQLLEQIAAKPSA
jgi:large conductance mechanosensitive channel